MPHFSTSLKTFLPVLFIFDVQRCVLSSYNCDFSTDQCSFTITKEEPGFEWKRERVDSTNLGLRRPNIDSNGKADGYTMYAKLGYFSKYYGKKTELISPEYTRSCGLRIAYYFDSQKKGSRFMVSTLRSSDGKRTNLLDIQGAQGAQWHKENYDIRLQTLGENFKVIVTAVHTTAGDTNSFILDYVWAGCDCSLNPCYHGTCAPVGTGDFKCNCDNGWAGIFCNEDIGVDACAINPCQNGATCQSNGGVATCKCPAGFLGQICQVVDPCTSQPCQNNGTCQGSTAGYNCSCPTGYGGMTCETVTDICSALKPCKNGGTCQSQNGGYSCVCTGDFGGNDCQIPIAPLGTRCDFSSSDLCNYIITEDDAAFAWKRAKVTSSDLGIKRPNEDSKGNSDGYTMYAKLTYGTNRAGKTTSLVSPVYTRACQIRFAYYFNSPKAGSEFSVWVMQPDNSAPIKIFSINGAKGDQWNEETVDIRSETLGDNFKVKIQAVHASEGSTNSYILDYIWVGCGCGLSPCNNGTCSETTMGLQCSCNPGWKGVFCSQPSVTTLPTSSETATTMMTSTSAQTLPQTSETTARTSQQTSETTAKTSQQTSETTAQTSPQTSGTTAQTTLQTSDTTAQTSTQTSETTAHTSQQTSETTAHTSQQTSETTAQTSQQTSETTAQTSQQTSATTAQTSQQTSATTAQTSQQTSETTALTSTQTSQHTSETTAQTSLQTSETTAQTPQQTSETTAQTSETREATTTTGITPVNDDGNTAAVVSNQGGNIPVIAGSAAGGLLLVIAVVVAVVVIIRRKRQDPRGQRVLSPSESFVDVGDDSPDIENDNTFFNRAYSGESQAAYGKLDTNYKDVLQISFGDGGESGPI